MTRGELFLAIGVGLAVLGLARLLLTGDPLRRVLGMNIAGAGVMLVLLALAHRADPDSPDPVPQALVLTGIVIMVAVTGVALGLIRRSGVGQDGRSNAGRDRPGGTGRSTGDTGREPDPPGRA